VELRSTHDPKEDTMKIGIGGASGHLGQATIKHLKARLAGKAEIVAITRTPEKLADLGVQARAGDFDKPEALADAFQGLDRLLLIPTDNMTPGIRAKQQSAAIEKAVAAGVGHIVLMSALGTRAAEVPHMWESYFVAEQKLMGAAKRWSILRMAYYVESFLDEARMTLPGGVHASLAATPVNFVSRDDVAAAAAGLLATDAHHGAIYQATGPVSYGGNARAAVIAEAAKAPFEFAQVTREHYAAGLKAAGLPSMMIDALLSIQDMWACGGFDVITGDVEHLAGRRPRSLAEAAKASFG
jgi:NAD(P)H dehydrogenase (quinone)